MDNWWSDDNDYPVICPGCGEQQIMEDTLFSQYDCLSIVSGATGKFMQSKECEGEK
jgi:hypothetical protein